MTSAAPGASSAAPDEPVFRRLLRATEVDTRMLGMIFALLLIWFGFNVYTQIQTGEGLFLTPRNLWNLSVQTSSIAIMGTGMVLVIVMRHIDLSVGSIIGFVSTIIGVAQARVFPVYLGFDNPTIWILAVLLALVIGAAIGAIHGSLVAYVGIPAFIVTLGGQLFWRGAAWLVTTGQTIAPLDERFALMGGGPHGSVGATASWAIAVLACAGIVFSLYAGRQRRARFRFPQRPMWAEYLIAVVGCLVVLGATTDRQRLSLARARRRDLGPGPSHPCSGRRAVHFNRLGDPGADRSGDRLYHDVHRPAHPVRPLRLRDRRQSGGGGTGRHQHQAHHGHGFRVDGHARRSRGLHRTRRGSIRRPTCSASSTSSIRSRRQ